MASPAEIDIDTSFLDLLRKRQKADGAAPCLHIIEKSGTISKTITVTELVRCVDRLSSWLDQHLEPYSGDGWDPIAYTGPLDIRYVLFPLAASQTGRVCANLSPRYSREDNEAFLEQTGGQVVICGDKNKKNVIPSCVPTLLEAPSLDELLSPRPAEYKRSQSVKLPSNPPLLTLGTGGSTGRPKCITITAKGCMTAALRKYLPDVQGRATHEKIENAASRPFVSWPVCHIVGFLLCLYNMCLYDAAPIIPSFDTLGDGELAVTAVRKAGADALCITPGVIEELYILPGGFEAAAQCKFVLSGGGFPNHEAATQLAQITSLVWIYGSTETMITLTVYQASPEDWSYLLLPSEHNSVQWRPQGGYHELVIVKSQRLAHMLGVFYHFPALDEWQTGDLFEPHPTKKDHWRCVGRRDDVVIFSSGAKLLPLLVEKSVLSSNLIASAFLVGHGRPFPIILVEPTTQPQSDDEHQTLRDQIWKHVRQCNQASPAQGQIASIDHIVLISTAEDELRNAKGDLSRNRVLGKYQGEIDEVYRNSTGLGGRNLLQRLDDDGGEV